MSARDIIEDALTETLPKGWKLIPAQTAIDTPSTTTVILKLRSLENAKEAPQGAYEYTFIATLVEPGEDVIRVEKALDDHVEDLWLLLEAIPNAQPTKAEKVAVGDALLGYDITFTALYAKEA